MSSCRLTMYYRRQHCDSEKVYLKIKKETLFEGFLFYEDSEILKIVLVEKVIEPTRV